MKKFLFVLLFAVIATSAVEDYTLEGWWDDIIAAIKKIIEKIKAIIQWLKDNGHWDTLIELLKKYGKPKAVEFCVKLIHKEELCNDIVTYLLSFIK